MRIQFQRSLLAPIVCAFGAVCASAQQGCPARPLPGTPVVNPYSIVSVNGTLTASFLFNSVVDPFGYLHECYNYQSPDGIVEAPVLRLNPGDRVNLSLTNRLTYVPQSPIAGSRHALEAARMAKMSGMQMENGAGRQQPNNPCTGGTMVPTSTNIHFHGLNVPPVCHQDEVILTDIENTDPAFQYSIQIPPNDSPGMYWYHPHLHGFSTLQVNGGAAGALIIQGMEKVKPQVAGLPERVFVIRQQFLNPNSWLPGPNQLTINYEPAISPFERPPTITMQPGAKEFWRVANASTQAFLALQFHIGSTPQKMEIIALDGIPVTEDAEVTTINLPPAGRAEFIVQGPPAGQTATFYQSGVNTGPIGNANPLQELLAISTSADANEPPAMPGSSAPSTVPPRFAGLAALTPSAQRKLYFAEATNGSNGPTEFFIVVDGHIPKVFSPSDPPAVTTEVGAVEDWTVENRTGEMHAFHIHQIHFLFLASGGVTFPNPELRDTVTVPPWSGSGPYPSVKMRMDFRDPEIAGEFVFHCHVLDHEDGGMMAIIKVNPK